MTMIKTLVEGFRHHLRPAYLDKRLTFTCDGGFLRVNYIPPHHININDIENCIKSVNNVTTEMFKVFNLSGMHSFTSVSYNEKHNIITIKINVGGIHG